MKWYENPDRHCRDLDHLFDIDIPHSSVPLVEICTRNGGCPALRDCLEETLRLDDRHGVRGGTAARTRAAALKALRKGSPEATKLVEALWADVQLLIDNNGRRPRKCPQTTRDRKKKPAGQASVPAA